MRNSFLFINTLLVCLSYSLSEAAPLDSLRNASEVTPAALQAERIQILETLLMKSLGALNEAEDAINRTQTERLQKNKNNSKAIENYSQLNKKITNLSLFMSSEVKKINSSSLQESKFRIIQNQIETKVSKKIRELYKTIEDETIDARLSKNQANHLLENIKTDLNEYRMCVIRTAIKGSHNEPRNELFALLRPETRDTLLNEQPDIDALTVAKSRNSQELSSLRAKISEIKQAIEALQQQK